jgi:DDE superfamily endonuclease
LKEQAVACIIELYYLDEAGFAPTLPVGYTWAREGVRAIVPYEAPQGRRVNAIGALALFGQEPRLAYATRTTSFKGGDVLEFIWTEVGRMSTPVGMVPEGFVREKRCVVVLDNYSPHHGPHMREQAEALEAAGIELFYLPPYSPELNLIEPLWRHLKHERMPIRSHKSAEELKGAVETALHQPAEALQPPAFVATPTAHAHTVVSVATHNAHSLPEAA